MLPSSKLFNFDGAIVSLKYNEANNLLTILDNAKQLHYLDLNSFELIRDVKLYPNDKTPYNYYKKSGILYDNNKLFLWPESSHYGYFIKVGQHPKPKYKFQYHKVPVSAVDFSDDGEFVLSADEKGRVALLNLRFGVVENSFPPFPDSISVAKFSPNSLYVAIACFNSIISIYDPYSMELICSINTKSVVEGIDFIDDFQALVILRDGRVLHIDVITGKIKNENMLLGNVWLTTIHLSTSKKFAYIGTRESKLYVLHVNSLGTMFDIDLKSSGISAINHNSQFLVIGYVSGDLLVIRYKEYANEFSFLVKSDKLKEATAYFDKNIFLMTDKSTKEIYKKWLEVKSTVETFFAEEKVEEAEKIAKVFLFHPKCRLEMEKIDADRSLYSFMVKYIRAKQFNQAYALCEKNPSLKKSIYFQQLEHYWNQLLSKAKRILSREPELNQQKARDILKPFLNVDEKKDFALFLLSHAYVFQQAKSFVTNKEFTQYFILIEKYPYLKHDNLYHKVERICEELKLKMVSFIEEESFEKAMQMGAVLQQFDGVGNFVKRKKELIKSLYLLKNILDRKNIAKACELVSKSELKSMKNSEVERYKNILREYIDTKSKMIQEGIDICSELRAFGEDKESFKLKRELIKKLYNFQIKEALRLKKERVDWDDTLSNYVLFFSIDEELLNVLKKYDIDVDLVQMEVSQSMESTKFMEDIVTML